MAMFLKHGYFIKLHLQWNTSQQLFLSFFLHKAFLDGLYVTLLIMRFVFLNFTQSSGKVKRCKKVYDAMWEIYLPCYVQKRSHCRGLAFYDCVRGVLDVYTNKMSIVFF